MNYRSDFWYCHESETDQSVRDLCQMSTSQGREQALAEADRLAARGYIVQQVITHTLCDKCDGTGRILKAPKGTRKTAKQLPTWRMTSLECATCNCTGVVASVLC